ncbi:MAG: hypothetical protein WC490_06875 [Candidatus Margulisiibacteriota bacterium]
MEQPRQGLPINRSVKAPFIIKSAFETEKMEAVPAPVQVVLPKMSMNSERFYEKLSSVIMPNLPAKELISMMVSSALEVEFGTSFTLNPNFAKMVGKIADSIMTNPDIRRQALSAASIFIEKKMQMGKKH